MVPWLCLVSWLALDPFATGSAGETPTSGEGGGAEADVVVSSTKTPEQTEEAPAIITLITRDGIRRNGYRSLGEILRNVVGFEVNDNGHWPDTGVRGVNEQTGFGDKIKIMIDGHNMAWRQFNRNLFNPTWISMEEIERIELIRGPGGTLWGANALAGVINIVTRRVDALQGVEATASTDHLLESTSFSLRAGGKLGETCVFASMFTYQDDADRLLAPLLEFARLGVPTVRVSGDEESGLGVRLRVLRGSFSLDFQRSWQETYAPLSTLSVLGGDDTRFVTDRTIVILAHSQMVHPTLELTTTLSFDTYGFGDGTVFEDNPLSPTLGDPAGDDTGHYLRKMKALDQRYELKTQAVFLPTPSFIGLLGVELEYLDVIQWHFPEVWKAAGLGTPRRENFQIGAMSDVQYSPVKFLELTAGVRLDYDEGYQEMVTPRAGVVLTLPWDFFVKGLFGMGYKPPSFHDLNYFRKNSFYGNPDLRPETSQTLEAQLGYRAAELLQLRVTGFFMRIDNLIGYDQRTGVLIGEDHFPGSQRPDGAIPYNQKVNLAHLSIQGVESELTLRLANRHRIEVSGTYRWPSGQEELFFSAPWQVLASVQLNLHKRLDLVLRAFAVGQKKVLATPLNEAGYRSWDEASDPTTSSPSTFVATVLLHLRLSDQLKLHLKLDNLTNRSWYEAGREVLYPQRRFQATLWMDLAI